MDRHKTQKKVNDDKVDKIDKDTFKILLEDSAKEAYARPWNRLERGLRLNRLRIFIEDISPQFNMTKEEKDSFFIFLQKAVDKKLLNTSKIVQYDKETQRIKTISGLEIKRNQDVLKWAFIKKQKPDGTRKKKAEDNFSVSTDATETMQHV